MKSEHRHELQTNELSKVTDHVGKFFEEYGVYVLIGVVVVAAVALGAFWWVSSSRSAAAEAWQSMIDADSPEDLVTTAERFPKSEVALWARLNAAEQFLDRGVRNQFTDRKAANDNLKDAEVNFESVLKSNDLPSIATQRALLGMARVKEATSDGDLTAAIDAYKDLVAKYPNSIFEKTAQQRIQALSKPSASEFYAWFQKQTPAPEDRPKPTDRQDGTQQPFEAPVQLPQIPARLRPPFETPPPVVKKPKESTAKPFPPDEKPEDKATDDAGSDKKSTPDAKTPEKPAPDADSTDKPADDADAEKAKPKASGAA